MSSPFTLFRRHERVLMVVITGLSMISFVLLGAVQDPRNVPTPLVVIFLAAIAGGIAWLAGLNSGKGSEWGLTGAVAGAVIGLGIAFFTREASAVVIDNGNLSTQEVSDLRRQRFLANRFINAAFQQTFGIGLESLPAPMQREYVFGFANGTDVSVQEVVLGELLRREADKMGIAVSDKVVTDYIKEVTSKTGLMKNFENVRGQLNGQEQAIFSFYLPQIKEKPFSSQTFTKIRQQLQVSETELLKALRAELKTRQAYRLLSGNNYFPPDQFWDYYRQLNVRESADVASVPLDSFIDTAAKPSESELVELFNRYRENPPGMTPDGRPEPGRLGFVQPRRIQLGYLEAVFDQIEPLVPEVSDADVQKLYEERYLRTVPENDSAATGNDGPALPAAPSSDKAAEKAPGMSAPATSNMEQKSDEKPASETKSTTAPAPEQDKKTDSSGGKKPNAEAEKQLESAPKKPALEAPASEKTNEQKESPSDKGETGDSGAADKKSSRLMSVPATQTVALLQAEKASDEQKADENKADEKKDAAAAPGDSAKKATDEKSTADDKSKSDKKPTAEDSAKPAGNPPAVAKPEMIKPDNTGDTQSNAAAASKKGDEAVPPAPTTESAMPAAPEQKVPPLDDELKAELREDLLRQRTREEIQKRIEKAQQFMIGISDRVQREKTAEDYLSLTDATQQLKDFAAKNGLIYVVTPPMSYLQMAESEDYPVGRAVSTMGQHMTIADSVFRTMPTDLYRIGTADNFTTLNAYAYWKLADKAAYVPETIDAEPVVREEVIAAWRLEKARPLAKARAEALAKMVRESDKSMAETIAEQTITGKENSLFVSVRNTGEFTWMQKPIVPPTGMQQSPPVRPSIIPGVTDAGREFFETVFDKMKVGDVSIAPDDDHSVYYVVKVNSRTPSTPEELAAMRQKFLEQGMQGSYSSLIQQSIEENSVNWLQQLFTEHKVDIKQLD